MGEAPQLGGAASEPAAMSDRSQPARPRSPARLALLALATMAGALVLWGGYGHHWPWTGINGHTATLWDWLHLMLLPLAFGMLPILLSERTRVRREHRLVGFTALACLAVFVFAGYDVPWSWTGFSGNRLWDWLELLALPLAVAAVPLIDDIRRGWTAWHSFVAAAVLVAFAVAVIGGYTGGWAWTGFRGNTLWDWLHLLLLPLLLPTVIVPKLKPRMEATMIVVEEHEQAPPAVEPAPAPVPLPQQLPAASLLVDRPD